MERKNTSNKTTTAAVVVSLRYSKQVSERQHKKIMRIKNMKMRMKKVEIQKQRKNNKNCYQIIPNIALVVSLRFYVSNYPKVSVKRETILRINSMRGD